MTLFEIAGFYIALNMVLLIGLAYRVGKIRMKAQVSLGDGGNFELQSRIRAHGNYTEYAPLALIGLFALAGLSAAPIMLHFFGSLFLFGRIAHAIGMDGKNALGKGRVIGMIMTLLTLIGQAACILFLIFT